MTIVNFRQPQRKKKSTDDQKSAEHSTGPLRTANKNPSSIDRSLTTLSSDISSKNDKQAFDETSHKQSAKSHQKQKFFDELIQREGSVETLLQTKKPAKTIYDVDVMTPEDIRKSLARIDANTAKPFSFLTDIIDDPQNEKRKLTTQGNCDQELNPSDIDLQLASLVKRVELNRTLLEKTNQRIKDINFITERNRMVSLRDMNYDEDSFLLMKEAGDMKRPVSPADLSSVSHPAIDELQQTISSTIKMLEYVHKMSNEDLALEEIPSELTDYLNVPIITAGENYFIIRHFQYTVSPHISLYQEYAYSFQYFKADDIHKFSCNNDYSNNENNKQYVLSINIITLHQADLAELGAGAKIGPIHQLVKYYNIIYD
ncbi:uncharacterized protein LOC124413634 [Diprion similis]|uniref:uncharacterized protein LOC124413634 n=1 Tax=Diprion similis TaxID=362088 RepID=UPI001EF84C28|nr:uncharacterized protein LOC124413634 [Diprion similis]